MVDLLPRSFEEDRQSLLLKGPAASGKRYCCRMCPASIEQVHGKPRTWPTRVGQNRPDFHPCCAQRVLEPPTDKSGSSSSRQRA